MGKFYYDGTQWRPYGGGGTSTDPQTVTIKSSDGGSSYTGLIDAAGDSIWDHFEPGAGGTSLRYAFSNMRRITSVPAFDTSSVTNMSLMFNACSSLTSVPEFNTSSVTDMADMFNGCSSLTSVPAFNTSRVTTMSNMFQNCSRLTSVPAFNTWSVKNMAYMFAGCSSLTSLPAFNTWLVTDMSSMFAGCRSLTSIPALDMSGVTYTSNAFGYSDLYSLTRFEAYGCTRGFRLSGTQMDAAALNELMSNLGYAHNGNQTLDIRYNPGSDSCDTWNAVSKGWTVLR